MNAFQKNDDYVGRRKVLEELYKGVKGADVDAELMADLVGDYLFTDEAFIRRLSTKNRNLFEKIYDEIKYLARLATAGSKEARELERVKRLFEKEYKEADARKADGTRFSLSGQKNPTYEELVSKEPIDVIDITQGIKTGSYAEMKKAALNIANENGWFDIPHHNLDTDSMIFITDASFSHAFNNLSSQYGENTIRCMAHIPEIIENAVLINVADPKNSNKPETRVYTFLGAVEGTNGVEPVKLTVKEFNFTALNNLKKNIKEYFLKNGISDKYNTLYDTHALEVVDVERIKKEPNASGKGDENTSQTRATFDSKISIADLLALVKGKAENYIPKAAHSSDFNSQRIKQAQLEIIQETNPMWDDYHTGIRTTDDIRTWAEVLELNDESEGQFVWGDFSRDDAEQALKNGTITVYSSYPIKNGTFVSTSYVQAQEYAGGRNGKVYSKTIPLSDVAWINGDEGQYAKVDKKLSLSKENASAPIAPLPGYNVRGEDIALKTAPLAKNTEGATNTKAAAKGVTEGKNQPTVSGGSREINELRDKITNLRARLDEVKAQRDEKLSGYQQIIDTKQALYDSKANKDTKVASNLMASIEHNTKLRDNAAAKFDEQIRKLESELQDDIEQLMNEEETARLTHEPVTSEQKQRSFWSYVKELLFDKGMVFETLGKKHKTQDIFYDFVFFSQNIL